MIELISYKDLNANQRCAVKWNSGPLLVLAGPGSGKTASLTLRIARLLNDDEHTAVLGLTFTNKAATEMRDRVDQLLGERTDRSHLCTFHHFAREILSQHGSHIGLRPDFDVLSGKEDRIAILEWVVEHLPSDDYPDFPEDPDNLLDLIDRLFSESYNGDGRFSALPSTPLWIQPLFQKYCRALINANRLDFGSLIFLTKQLLRTRPTVARVVRMGWTHVCVDEFQDTNQAQYDLLRLIAPERDHNLFVVADDDQLIYQWRGASIQRLKNLERDYELHILQFPESYRCPPEIVKHANHLVEYNRIRLPNKKELVSLRQRCISTANEVRYQVFPSLQEEAIFVGKDLRTRGLTPKDCAVLGRTTKLLHNAVRELCSAGYEAFLFQKKIDFDSPLVNVMVEALRLAHLRHDRFVLGRLCRGWHLLTGDMIEVHAVDAQAALVGGDFLRAWLNVAKSVSDQKWIYLVQLFKEHLLDRLNFHQIINWLRNDEWKSLQDHYILESTEEEVTTWMALDQQIVSEHGTNVSLNTYLREIAFSSKTPLPKENAIQCMTVHQSKGLQFKHVYLIGMAHELFPSYRALRSGPNSKQMEEERRSCYVAVTRVQNTLTLTRSEKYFGYLKEPSQFLAEMKII